MRSLLALAVSALAMHAMAARPLERMVVLDVRPVDAGSTASAQVLSEVVLTELSKAKRWEILGQSDVATLLGLERQKQLLGCNDSKSSSCLAEIGGALGAPYLFVTTLGRVGSAYRLDAKILDTQKNRVVAREGASISSENELVPQAKRVVRSLVAATAPAGEVAQAAPASGGPSTLTYVSIGTLAAGAIAAGAGGWLLSSAASFNGAKQSMTFDEAAAARAVAVQQQGTGAALVIGGGAVAAVSAGVLLYSLWSHPEPDALAVIVPTRGGAAVNVSARF